MRLLVFLYDSEGAPPIVESYRQLGVFNPTDLLGVYRTASPRYNLIGTPGGAPVAWPTPPNTYGAYIVGHAYTIDQSTAVKLVAAKAKAGMFPHILQIQNNRFTYSTTTLTATAFFLAAPPILSKMDGTNKHITIARHADTSEMKQWVYKDAINRV